MTPAQDLARRTVLYALYCVTVSAAAGSVLMELLAHARADESASHVVVVPLIAAGLIARNRESIFAHVRSAPLPGVAIALIGAGLTAGAAMAGGTSILAPWFPVAVGGILVMWAGGFLAFYGADATRRAAFPLLFLLATIPVPSFLLDAVTHVLKVGSAEAVAVLFSLTGTPYHRADDVFSLPTVAIEVADECSGIRSTIALVLTAVIAGDAFLRRGWSRLLLVLAVVPITILKNAVRIVTLSLLATYVHPSFLFGRLHNDGGVLFFLVALGLLLPVAVLLRRSESPRVRPAAGQPAPV